MILKEDYFDDLKLTDDDIESSDDIVISNNNKYDNPEQMFIDMKSIYTHCIEIPLKHNYQWKVEPKLIIKRMSYVFDAYGIEYSEPTLQEYIMVDDNLEKGYSQCKFIDYDGYKLISSKYKTIEAVNMSSNTISVLIFFNLPDIHSYKSACFFVGSIINCLLNDSIKDLHFDDFYVWDFNPIPYKRSFTLNKNIIGVIDIETIIKMFFPEKSATIKRELCADNNALLNKLLKCF